jgi:hypothetical protein
VRWVLLWAVLLLGAALVFFLLGRRLWRQAKALTVELGTATDRLTALTDRLAELQTSPISGDELADGVRSQGPRRQP